jgi:hypothetical protein
VEAIGGKRLDANAVGARQRACRRVEIDSRRLSERNQIRRRERIVAAERMELVGVSGRGSETYKKQQSGKRAMEKGRSHSHVPGFHRRLRM